MSGKYRGGRKEVVSDFTKELIACMGFLNQREIIGTQKWTLSACFS
jgi:hypothetical protein